MVSVLIARGGPRAAKRRLEPAWGKPAGVRRSLSARALGVMTAHRYAGANARLRGMAADAASIPALARSDLASERSGSRAAWRAPLDLRACAGARGKAGRGRLATKKENCPQPGEKPGGCRPLTARARRVVTAYLRPPLRSARSDEGAGADERLGLVGCCERGGPQGGADQRLPELRGRGHAREGQTRERRGRKTAPCPGGGGKSGGGAGPNCSCPPGRDRVSARGRAREGQTREATRTGAQQLAALLPCSCRSRMAASCSNCSASARRMRLASPDPEVGTLAARLQSAAFLPSSCTRTITMSSR